MAAPNQNILWIDCEMTGLNAYLPPADLPQSTTFRPDRILEIAAIVTNKELEPLDEGVEYIVKTDQEVLDNMNEWCINQHGKTGLTASCLSSTTDLATVDDLVSSYVARHFAKGEPALLAGNSVHADRAFINKDLPKLAALLHYRILDVSSIKELTARWYPELQRPRKEDSAHRALSDIQHSISELRHYRENVFKASQ